MADHARGVVVRVGAREGRGNRVDDGLSLVEVNGDRCFEARKHWRREVVRRGHLGQTREDRRHPAAQLVRRDVAHRCDNNVVPADDAVLDREQVGLRDRRNGLQIAAELAVPRVVLTPERVEEGLAQLRAGRSSALGGTGEGIAAHALDAFGVKGRVGEHGFELLKGKVDRRCRGLEADCRPLEPGATGHGDGLILQQSEEGFGVHLARALVQGSEGQRGGTLLARFVPAGAAFKAELERD